MPNLAVPLNRWVLDHSLFTKIALYLLGFVVLFAILAGIVIAIYPSQTSIVTRHKLEFVPANFLQVQDVKNYFSQNQGFVGGAGGIGAPQVEMSISQYVENTGNTNLHYAVFRPIPGRVNSQLEYWSLESSKAIVTFQYFDSPWHYSFGLDWGYWGPRTGEIEGQEIAIRRTFIIGGWFIVMFFVFLISLLVYGLGGWVLIERKIDEITDRGNPYKRWR